MIVHNVAGKYYLAYPRYAAGKAFTYTNIFGRVIACIRVTFYMLLHD
jgi:hypothetical protein